MKFTRQFLIATLALLAAACGKEPVNDGPRYGDLGIFFDADEFTLEAGGTLEIPFTVTGSEGATLNIEGVCSDQEIKAKTKYNAEYQGNVTLTAPEIVVTDRSVKVTLTASDSHGRSLSKSVDVTVKASATLEITSFADVKSMAVKAGGSFTLSYIITGLEPAKLKADPAVTLSSGWNSSVKVDGNKFAVTFTAPATIGNSLSIDIVAEDDHGRKAEYKTTLGIVAITVAANAANCHIVKPGSTLTINAVKGNSAEKLVFEGAKLLWQDCVGLVKSVSGNGVDGVVVVELNAGKSGNAVVAAINGDEIVWNWHLWVSDFDPMADPFVYEKIDTTINKVVATYTFMDRNLGALSSEKYSAKALGLIYQWGRKDPFSGGNGVESNAEVPVYDIDGKQLYFDIQERPVYGKDDHTSTNLDLSIKNPMVFYTAPSSSWPVVDWLTDNASLQNDDLWGGVSKLKTVYDPCPEGWRVPEAGDSWSFRKEYKKSGALTDSGKYDSSRAWYIEYDDAYCIGFRYKTASGKEYWWPFSGHRDPNKGTIASVGGGANYFTCTPSQTTVINEVLAWGNPSSETGLNRSYGSSVRCIKE